MAPSILKKRKIEDGVHGRTARPKKKFRKQLEYHSSSSEDDEADETIWTTVKHQDFDGEDNESLQDDGVLGEDEMKIESGRVEGTGNSDASDSDDDSQPSASVSDSGDSLSDPQITRRRKKLSKRNDPSAFSTSIAKILSTKLSTSVRADPVLSRSKSTAQNTSDLVNEKLERRARAKLRAEKKEELDRDRIKDVLGVQRGEAGEIAEQEKRLRKIAQRGVVKLFNAVRAAQVRGERQPRRRERSGP